MQAINLAQQAYEQLIQTNYGQSAIMYQQLAEQEPDQFQHYWYLGIALLLAGDESAAQSAWFTPLLTGTDDSTLTSDLVGVLAQEANRLENFHPEFAYLLRCYLQEFDPGNLENGLHLLRLALDQEQFSWELPQIEFLPSLLEQTPSNIVNLELLITVLKIVLDRFPQEPGSYEFAKACSPHASQLPELVQILQKMSQTLGWGFYDYTLAAKYGELVLEAKPTDPFMLTMLSQYYMYMQRYDRAIDLATRLYNYHENLVIRCAANQLLIQSLILAGGYWDIAIEKLELHWKLISNLLEAPQDLSRFEACSLFIMGFSPPHLEDKPSLHKPLLNSLMRFAQSNVKFHFQQQHQEYRHHQKQRHTISHKERKMRIGYLSDNLRSHAVGWLAWSLYEFCNQENFEIYTYFNGTFPVESDGWRHWYARRSNHYYVCEPGGYSVADRIHQDEIDILVDLDSLTLPVNCEVLALKPAPIQVTWLGFDASGLPAVDYFIADPYVLPEHAQSYYSETIWRLPQTYLAVNGFMVGSPTLRREDLDIPGDAVIYLSSQRAAKRNPHMTRLQMQIIKEVPQSYLLIKGYADQELLQAWFSEIAESEGVSIDQIKFIPSCPTVEEHRANLAIADVVLDTYPYNGATTTLETLWMEVPLVTRVGEQFAARNSYTFLVNAGVEEGIAWTDEEYVEWGIRLGRDKVLRERVMLKLKAAKKTAPLWNAKQFTRQMEEAYQSMWRRYLDGS